MNDGVRRHGRWLVAGTVGLATLLGCPKSGTSLPPPPPAAASAEIPSAPTVAADDPTDDPSPSPAVETGSAPQLVRSVPLLATDLTEVLLGDAVTLPAVILYFSTGCPHCWNVAPEFQEACDDLAGDGVSCIAVASVSTRLGGLREFSEATGLSCPAYVDYAAKFRDAHGMSATPTALYFAADGRIAFAADPFYRGASLALRRAVAEDQGRDPDSIWQADRYYGSRPCAVCHEVEYNSWLLSPHGVAIQRLPGDTHEDRACLRCHATATGEPGGFVDLLTTGHLRDVGCEACHGRAGGHTSGGLRPDRPQPTDSCRSCHDPGHSLSFDAATAMAAIDHELAGRLPREQWNTRRTDLEQGRTERVALQMVTGECAGDSSCAACHAEEVDAWAAGPHATALQTLIDEGSRRDESCLACHQVAGPCSEAPPPRKQPGISCEACHGAAADHVSSDGQTPPPGLRAEHAAECVVEPVCRGCHTEIRDPGWDLTARLAGVHPHAGPDPAPGTP